MDNEHVVPRKNGWAVKSAGSKRASKIFDTKGEAIEYAKELALKYDVCMMVHDQDGRFEEFDCEPNIGDQHVVKKGEMWAVIERGGKHISKIFERKGAAMAHAYDLAERHGSCMLVHDDEGNFKSVSCPPEEAPGILEVIRMKTKI